MLLVNQLAIHCIVLIVLKLVDLKLYIISALILCQKTTLKGETYKLVILQAGGHNKYY